jgi:hypothetical protein
MAQAAPDKKTDGDAPVEIDGERPPRVIKTKLPLIGEIAMEVPHFPGEETVSRRRGAPEREDEGAAALLC